MTLKQILRFLCKCQFHSDLCFIKSFCQMYLWLLLTCKSWLQEAERWKASREDMEGGLGGAPDLLLEWALRKFWHCGLTSGSETCTRYRAELIKRKQFKDYSQRLLPVAEPSPWRGHFGILRRSTELWLELDVTLLSRPPAPCSAFGSPGAGVYFLYQSHIPAVLKSQRFNIVVIFMLKSSAPKKGW